MKITRERLKQIVIQEMARLEEDSGTYTDVDASGSSERASFAPEEEEDDAEIVGQVTEGFENITHENMAIVWQALGQMVGNFAPSVIAAALAMPLMDAIEYLKKNKPPEPPASRDDY